MNSVQVLGTEQSQSPHSNVANCATLEGATAKISSLSNLQHDFAVVLAVLEEFVGFGGAV